MKLSDTHAGDVAIPEFGRPLREIVSALGTEIVSPVNLPETTDPTVRGLDFYDAQSTIGSGEGDLLGLISAESMKHEDLDRAIVNATANGCAGVVFKASGIGAQRIVQRAAYLGMPALQLTDSVTWREFDALLTRLLGEDAPSLQLAPSTGDKLFALANTIARVFSGSVAIEDHRRSILAHSSVPGQAMDELRTQGILYRRAGDAPVNERRYREVLRSESFVRFPAYRQFLPRVAIAVRAGSIPLGSIWVLDPEGADPSAPLPTEHREILEQSAVIAAEYLLDAWRGENLTVIPREEAIKRLLLGSGQLGDAELVDPSGEQQGVLAVMTLPARSQSAVRTAEIRGVIGRHLSIYDSDAIVTVIGREIIALCGAESADLVRGWILTALRDLSPTTRDEIRAGLSQPRLLRSGLPYALAEAREVALNANAHHEWVATLPQVRTRLFLEACAATLESDDRLILPSVTKLLEDGERGQHFAETLDCWLQERCSVSRAAHRLRIHEQTVRYRLRKLTEILDIDAADPDHLLAVWLQVRLLRMMPAE